MDINRVNALRPVLQKLSHLTKKYQCAMILVSHVNKRAQSENANNAATGSNDFINASRSAFRVIFDESNKDCRVMVHTKTNYAAYGESVRYRIDDGGVVWDGFSEITRQTLEMAARKRATPWEIIQKGEEKTAVNSALIEALEASSNQFVPMRYTYDDFKKSHGEWIFVSVKFACAKKPAARGGPGSGLKKIMHCREPERSKAAEPAQHPVEPDPSLVRRIKAKSGSGRGLIHSQRRFE